MLPMMLSITPLPFLMLLPFFAIYATTMPPLRRCFYFSLPCLFRHIYAAAADICRHADTIFCCCLYAAAATALDARRAATLFFAFVFLRER